MPEGSLERRTMRKVLWRIMPLLLATYFVSITDRANLGIAAIQMNQDLGVWSCALWLGCGDLLRQLCRFRDPKQSLSIGVAFDPRGVKPRSRFTGKRFRSSSSPLTEMRPFVRACSNRVPWSACSSLSAKRLCGRRSVQHYRVVERSATLLHPGLSSVSDRETRSETHVARHANRVRC
jgi:hypothetical protein